MDNIRTVYQSMPSSIGGFTLYSGLDDYFTIVLNQNLSHEKNLESYAHEMSHILNHDFDKSGANKIEINAHGG